MRPRSNAILLAFFFGITVIVSCDNCVTPSSILADPKRPDLLYDFARIKAETVDIDEALFLESAILNKRADCSGCTTSPASPSNRAITAEYRANANEPWVNALIVDIDGMGYFELVKPVPEIRAGQKYPKTEGFKFEEPGLYRYGLMADSADEVSERDENNNDASSNDGTVKAAAPRRFILEVTVVDPDRKTLPKRNPDQPVVITYLK